MKTQSKSENDYTSQVTGDFNPISLRATDISKSVKADDAEIPLGLWNEEIFKGSKSEVEYDPNVHDAILLMSSIVASMLLGGVGMKDLPCSFGGGYPKSRLMRGIGHLFHGSFTRFRHTEYTKNTQRIRVNMS